MQSQTREQEEEKQLRWIRIVIHDSLYRVFSNKNLIKFIFLENRKYLNMASAYFRYFFPHPSTCHDKANKLYDIIRIVLTNNFTLVKPSKIILHAIPITRLYRQLLNTETKKISILNLLAYI